MSERYVTEETLDTFGWPREHDEEMSIEEWRDSVLATGELTDWDLDQLYREYLDSVYDVASIAGMEYDTSRALKEVDPIAYRVGFHEWLDAELRGGHIVDVDEVEA